MALFDDDGSFGKGVPTVAEQLGKAPGITVTKLKGPQIGDGTLKNEAFDVVIFTGGSGSKQAKAIGEAGLAQVQSFVENGGGYVGICAGAYLACEGFSWGAKMLDAKTVSSKWKRGVGDVKIEVHRQRPRDSRLSSRPTRHPLRQRPDQQGRRARPRFPTSNRSPSSAPNSRRTTRRTARW